MMIRYHVKNCDNPTSICIKGHWYCMKHGLNLLDDFFEERERNMQSTAIKGGETDG